MTRTRSATLVQNFDIGTIEEHTTFEKVDSLFNVRRLNKTIMNDMSDVNIQNQIK